MRKHDVRKWLHAILDLLPVLVIPLFMIYSSNKNYESTLAIDVPQYEEVDFNQLCLNGDFSNGFNSWSLDSGSTYEVLDDGCKFIMDGSTSRVIQYSSNFVSNSKYLVRFSTYCEDSNGQVSFYSYIGSSLSYYTIISPTVYYQDVSYIFDVVDLYSVPQFQFRLSNASNLSNKTFYLKNVNLFNLTQMFGVGNEPTVEEFNIIYSHDYYETILSHHELVEYGSQTFNDSDVGSQMFYTLYNSVDKYFNMGNVFNLDDVYDWFVVNVFHGNVAPAVYIVYQIVIYELIMDLLFLLYALFMWFIDMIEKLMEKPLNSVR